MTQKQLAEIIVTFRKLEIDNNSYLTHEEKEMMKHLIDEIKKQVR